jgi:hypothetical protein
MGCLEDHSLAGVVDKCGTTIDFRPTKASRRHSVLGQITIDGSAANVAAIKQYNEAYGTTILIRQVK